MKILVLEDENNKYDAIEEHIKGIVSDCEIRRVTNWLDYTRATNDTKFDLILLDLLVPKSPRDRTVEDHHDLLVSATRDYSSKSFLTPAIVLTKLSLNQGDFMHDLNQVDINVIPFNDHCNWKEALTIKLLTAQPKKTFEFVIVCALEEEAAAFEKLSETWGPIKTISGLVCREVQFGAYKGAIIRAYRMGLVAAAVVTTMALERFEPRLVCMSGICGGVAGESEVYDLLITQTCHQHDAGKWGTDGFKSEHYSVQIDAIVESKLTEICSNSTLKSSLLKDLNAGVSEIPLGKERVSCNIRSSAVTSSGSAVIGEDGKASTLADGQRKLAGFDMEIYSVYEAARHAVRRSAFFAAKVVVDDGDSNKGDHFHRIGCLLAARFVAHAIRAGVADAVSNPE
jgi:nucleoside phosphorylase